MKNFGVFKCKYTQHERALSINANAPICRKIHGTAQGGKAAHVELLCNWMNGWSRRHLSINEANPVSSTYHPISSASQVCNGNANSIQKALTSAWVVDFPVGLASRSISEWLVKFSMENNWSGHQGHPDDFFFFFEEFRWQILRCHPKDFM